MSKIISWTSNINNKTIINEIELPKNENVDFEKIINEYNERIKDL